MTEKFKVVDLDQDGEAWHQWRASGLGGSDAPTILGQNPWKSADELLAQRVENVRTPANAAMLEGTRNEIPARARYQSMTGNPAEPACLQCREHDFMLASVDGIDRASRTVLEVKCGKGSYFKSLRMDGYPPDYYMAQLQHILAVTGYDQIDYFSWRPDRSPLLATVERDETMIEELIEKERLFWNRLSALNSQGA